MSAHLLAKLTPHGVVITGAGFGGQVEISGLDVAGALGMGSLSRPAYMVGLAKYAGDHQALVSLTRIAYAHATAMAAGKWGGERELLLVCAAAIQDCLTVNICNSCNGSGVVAAKPCEHCHGVGRLPPSIRNKARLFGLPKTTYHRVWEPRVRQVSALLEGWEAEAARHLWLQFRRDEKAAC